MLSPRSSSPQLLRLNTCIVFLLVCQSVEVRMHAAHWSDINHCNHRLALSIRCCKPISLSIVAVSIRAANYHFV
jgi:hypothetical protein